MDVSTVTFQGREIPVAVQTDTYHEERVYTVRFNDELLQEIVENPFTIRRKHKDPEAPYQWDLITKRFEEHEFKGAVAKAIREEEKE